MSPISRVSPMISRTGLGPQKPLFSLCLVGSGVQGLSEVVGCHWVPDNAGHSVTTQTVEE